MILFFRTPSKSVIATEIDHKPSQDEINELCWLYSFGKDTWPMYRFSSAKIIQIKIRTK